MSNNYRDLAADLSKNALELIKQILVKHEAAILEEMHDQLKKLKAERLTPEEKAVIDAALSFDSCMSEFDGEPQYCGEYLDYLFNAIDKLRESRNNSRGES